MISEFTPSILFQSVGWSLLHFLWQGTLVAGVTYLLLSCWPRKKSNARYAISCLALAAMVLCPVFTLSTLLTREIAKTTPAASVRLNSEATTERVATVSRSPSKPKKTTTKRAATREPLQKFEPAEEARSAPAESHGFVWSPDSIKQQVEPAFPILIGLWVFGVLFLSSKFVLGWREAHLLQQSGSRIEGELNGSLSRLKRKLNIRRTVDLRKTVSVHSPMVVGWLKPVVLFPISALTQLSPDQLTAILAHELAHIRRADYFVNLVQNVVEILLFYHPAVWWISKQIRLERENCCDDLVLAICNDKKDYVQALLKLEETRMGNRKLVLASSGGDLVQRVARILDKHRRPKRKGWLAGVVSAALVGVLLYAGTSKPTAADVSRIHDNTIDIGSDQEKLQDQDADNITKSEKRKIEVRVVGPDKKPVVGAQVMAGIWYQGTAGTERFVTNEEGTAEITLPAETRIVRIWAWADGFTRLFANWEEEETKQGIFPPDEFTFQLITATQVGGVVVDEQNRPIEGVSVEVRQDQDRNKPTTGRIKPGTWLAEGDSACITDENGQWSLNNVPPGNGVKLTLKFTHPDFISDERWGEIQASHSFGLTELRAQTAEVTLRKGIQIRGSITDPNGDPVNNALIVWGDNPYFQTGSQEIMVDPDGTYLTPTQKPGKLRVTVVAQGFAPETTQVEVEPNMDEVNFAMSPGHELKIQFVDEAGEAIPNVWVGIERWRYSNALYNNRHPNVLATGIPVRSDGQGIYTWEWAPEDTVGYSFHANGYVDQHDIPLVATGELQTITLKRPTIASGTVTDENGTPIPKFQVIPRLHLNDQITSERRDSLVVGRDGKFELKLESQPGTYSLKVVAEGYQTQFTDTFLRDEPPRDLSIELTKATSIAYQVVNSNNQPIAGATAAVAPKGQVVSMNGVNDRFALKRTQTQTSNNTGSFELPSSPIPRTIMVFAEEGYGEIADYPNQEPETIQIENWSSVEAKLTRDGKPWQARYYYRPTRYLHGSSFHIQLRASGLSNSDGQFQISQILPMTGAIDAYSQDSPGGIRYQIAFTPNPGKVTELDFTNAANLKAKVQFEGNNKSTIDLERSRFRLRRVSPSVEIPSELLSEIKEIGINPKDYREVHKHYNDAENWHATQSYAQCFDSYTGHINSSGELSIDVLRPGKYELEILAHAKSDSTVNANPMSDYRMLVEVNEGTTDLGNLTIKLFPDPTRGVQVDNFKIQNLREESEIRLEELRGKYVLLDFWTPWCDSCRRDSHKVERLAKLLGSTGKTDIVSIMANGSGPVRRVPTDALQGLKWIDGKIKYSNESEIRKHLGVWTSQHFVLLDPNGKFIAGGSFATIAKRLEELDLK